MRLERFFQPLDGPILIAAPHTDQRPAVRCEARIIPHPLRFVALSQNGIDIALTGQRQRVRVIEAGGLFKLGQRVLILAALDQRKTESQVETRKLFEDVTPLTISFNRFICAPRQVVDPSDVGIDDQRTVSEPERLGDRAPGLIKTRTSLRYEIERFPIMSGRIIAIEFNGMIELLLRFPPVPIIEKIDTPIEV
jgi:hypothetical protein